MRFDYYIAEMDGVVLPSKFDFVIQTKASIAKANDYFSHPENLPKFHPDFVKDVKILNVEGDTITLVQQMELVGRRLRAVNRLLRKGSSFETETIEGDGKGTKLMISLREIPSGTEILYSAELEFGSLGFFIKGPARASFEKVAIEDKKALDNL